MHYSVWTPNKDYSFLHFRSRWPGGQNRFIQDCWNRSKWQYARLAQLINCFATNPTNRFATNPTDPTDRFATNPTNPIDRLQGTNSDLDAQILFAFMTLNRFLELISSAEQSICILCEKYFRSVFWAKTNGQKIVGASFCHRATPTPPPLGVTTYTPPPTYINPHPAWLRAV